MRPLRTSLGVSLPARLTYGTNIFILAKLHNKLLQKQHITEKETVILHVLKPIEPRESCVEKEEKCSDVIANCYLLRIYKRRDPPKQHGTNKPDPLTLNYYYYYPSLIDPKSCNTKSF